MASCFFLYCTPENVVRNAFFKTLIQSQAHRIRCIVFDEAHEWLVDWRTNLLTCSKILADMLPNTCTFACTATCSTTDLPRLLQRLHLPPEPQLHRFSADRSNCFLKVLPTKDKASNLRYMFEQIDGVQKPATLVFVESKKEAERFSLGLKALITASSTLSEHENVHFNSELSAAEKKRILQRFYLDGIIRCIVCTQAFGTSVDLPSVRLVVHYCLL